MYKPPSLEGYLVDALTEGESSWSLTAHPRSEVSDAACRIGERSRRSGRAKDVLDVKIGPGRLIGIAPALS